MDDGKKGAARNLITHQVVSPNAQEGIKILIAISLRKQQEA